MNRSFLTGALAMGVAATTAIVAPQPAEALEVNFGFDGTGGQASSWVFTDLLSGLQVTATGTDVGGGNRKVFQGSNGLGVTTFLDTALNGTPLQVDGFGIPGSAEILNLSFNKQVRLISVLFANAQANDDFGLIVDNSFIGIDNIFGNNPYDFTGTYISQNFGFLAPGLNDDFFVKGITVEVIPTPAAVLPALMGMGAAAFRKKKQVAEAAQDA